MLNPVAMAIVASTFPDPAERARAIGVFGSMSGLSLGLGPILGGALVDGFGWRSIFWINVPIVAAAIVGSRAVRARVPCRPGAPVRPGGPDPGDPGPGQRRLRDHRVRRGWAGPRRSPSACWPSRCSARLGILGYESRRADPLLELRLFRSVPFSAAILMALFALCGFGAFLFVTTLYLQDVRGMSALAAGLCLLPVGGLVVVLSPVTGRLIGARGPRLPLVVAGAALALGGGASAWLGPATPLPAVLAIYLLFGVFLGTVNPPITNTAVSGMPRSMAGVAASLASAGRQTGTTLGVAISGTIVGPAWARNGMAFTSAEHGVWWLVLGLGAGILVLGLLSTGRRALGSAQRACRPVRRRRRGRRAGPGLAGRGAEIVVALMTRVICSPVPYPGLGNHLGYVLGAMNVGLGDTHENPLHWLAARMPRLRNVKIKFLHARGSDNAGVAVYVQADEIVREVREEDADVRVLQHVAETGHHAVAPVLGIGDGAVVQDPDEAGGPARKLQSHCPEPSLVAMNAISMRWMNCCMTGVS